MSVEEIEDLKNRIDNLEYKDIKGIREDVNQIKIDQAKIGVITENATKAIEKLNETLDSSKETMIAMAQSIKDSNNISAMNTSASQILTEGDLTIFSSYRDWETDRKSTRLNSSHSAKSRMPSSA